MGLLLAWTWATVAAAAAPVSPAPVDYDTFMRANAAPRAAAFGRLRPAEKAEIMKTHMRRWQQAHRERLSAEQHAVIDENVATLAPDFYRQPTTKEWRDKAIALFHKADAVFTQEQMQQLFTLDGDYLPPPS